MNIFVLNTGRCGSTTFIKACTHISNFTSAHESRCNLLGEDRFSYPENHIEADNRISWFLGRLDKHYGDNAFYIHLKRDRNSTARSFVKRYKNGIINSYRKTIILGISKEISPITVSLDYYDTVNSNIELFLKDKSKKMDFHIEDAKKDFQRFWKIIGAEGNIDAALDEFDIYYNASTPTGNSKKKLLSLIHIMRKLSRET